MSDSASHASRARADARAARHRLLGDPTRVVIVEALADGPRVMSELVSLTGVHRNTVRSHLARLEEAGVVERERVERQGPGRPAVRYHLHGALVPVGVEQRILIGSLVRLVADAYAAGADEEARDEGLRVGRQLGARHGHHSVAEALRGVTRLLRRLAFAPELSQRGNESEIALHACPFAVTPDDPRGAIICAFHLGLIRGVLEAGGPPVAFEVRLLPHVAPSLCRAEVRALAR
jgi:predicted ArsR family transcriptional regulator